MSSASSELDFETAMKQLETIVRQLEQGNLDLEKAIELYETGTALRLQCENKLHQAKLKIDKLLVDKNGSVSGTQPFERLTSLADQSPL